MKKLFSRDKPKNIKSPPQARDLASPGIPYTPQDSHSYYSQQQSYDRGSIRVSSDEHWDIVSHDGGSPLLGTHSPRAVSPFGGAPLPPPKAPSTNGRSGDREPGVLKKKAPAAATAVGILKALDPHPDTPLPTPRVHVDRSDEHSLESAHRDGGERKKGFWERATERGKEDKDKRDKEKRERRDDEGGQAELTRMIGYLTATASEDWSLVLEVCERAASSEASAKEAVKALRKEFKWAEATAQLSAARLWAIMLRNSGDVFLAQCSSRKFLDTLEDVLASNKTSPVVRERLLWVLAGAAFMSPSGGRHDKEGFRGLWRKVKAPDQPEQGIPFDTEDAMFQPPSFREPPPSARPPEHQQQQVPRRPSVRHKPSSRNKVIAPEEDRRRLLQECEVGSGNARLLGEALLYAKPEDLKHQPVIREFYARCRASQELIYGQIPWASAGAERSRLAAGRGSPQSQKRTRSGGGEDPRGGYPVARSDSGDSHFEPTQEELLLGALLRANEELTDALRQYEDLERVGIERDAEERSRKETRIDRNQIYYDENGSAFLEPPHPYFGSGGATSSHTPSPSSSPSPSPAPSVLVTAAHPHAHGPLPPVPSPHAHLHQRESPHAFQAHLAAPALAPPPPAPHGPRQPQHSIARSRTPSPDRSSFTHSGSHHTYDRERDRERELVGAVGRMRVSDSESPEEDEEEPVPTPARPSAKALGKRRAAVPDDNDSAFDPDDLFYEHANDSRPSEDFAEQEDEDETGPKAPPWHHPVNYVYDAAAERMQARLREGHIDAPTPGVVH